MGQLVQLGQEEITPPPVYVPDVNIVLPEFYPPPAAPPAYEEPARFQTTAFGTMPGFSPWWIIGGLALLLVLQTSHYAPERKARGEKRKRLHKEIASKKAELARTSWF